MNSAISALGKANPHSHVTPFDQVLACEEREEARVQAVIAEQTRKEEEAEKAMRDSEETQGEQWRTAAREELVAERDTIGKEMEGQEKTIQKELQALEEDALKRAPAIVEQQVETVLSPDFLSLAA